MPRLRRPAGDVQARSPRGVPRSSSFPRIRGRAAAVAQKIAALGAVCRSRSSARQRKSQPSGRWKWLAALGPAGLLIWKFKFLVVALLTKGKFLLLGLTKAGTLASMFASVGLYWTQWGLWFALGLVLSIYVHEMGHVAAIRRYGIAATAPMFIPGFGALIRLKQAPVTPRENARIGLAGPVWGLGAAVAAALCGVSSAGGPMAQGHRAHGCVDQHPQPGAGLAARRQPGLCVVDPPASLDRHGGARPLRGC